MSGVAIRLAGAFRTKSPVSQKKHVSTPRYRGRRQPRPADQPPGPTSWRMRLPVYCVRSSRFTIFPELRGGRIV